MAKPSPVFGLDVGTLAATLAPILAAELVKALPMIVRVR
jgi:hypothetical protein